MKKMRKLTSLLLVLVMVLGLATTAFAANYSISITEDADAPREGHTYTVYQIFTGDLDTVDGKEVLSDVKYGANYTPGETVTGDHVEDSVLDEIKDASAFAKKLIDEKLLEGTYNVLYKDNNWTITNVVPGYYLIVDTTVELPDYHTRSAVIVQVVGDVAMTPKSGVVDIVKKVKDINDSVETDIDEKVWQDSADHDIGDIVPYQITSNIIDIDEFTTYEVQFVDTMSKGLTYNKDAKITMKYVTLNEDGEATTGTIDVTSAFELTEAAYAGDKTKYTGGKVYTWTCTDLKALVDGNLLDATITIDYTCTLNADASVGSLGNPNEVYLVFNREPGEDKPSGKTPEDTVIVFTFKTDVNKVDPQQKPLTGAAFKLEKFIASETGKETYKGITGDWVVKTLVKNDEGTTFSFKGMDDGYYRITETQAPAGYNSIDPIYFTVTGTHNEKADDPKLTDLETTAVKPDGTSYTEAELESGEVAQFDVDPSEGAIATRVVNNRGVELPETGGIGTTIFYIVGGVLVLAAVVLLVTKKRMSHEA